MLHYIITISNIIFFVGLLILCTSIIKELPLYRLKRSLLQTLDRDHPVYEIKKVLTYVYSRLKGCTGRYMK